MLKTKQNYNIQYNMFQAVTLIYYISWLLLETEFTFVFVKYNMTQA